MKGDWKDKALGIVAALLIWGGAVLGLVATVVVVLKGIGRMK